MTYVPLRRFARQDSNLKAVVLALRAAGARVLILNSTIDLLVGVPARKGVPKHLVLVEVKKNKKEKLTPSQQLFFETWADYPLYKVSSVADVMELIFGLP